MVTGRPNTRFQNQPSREDTSATIMSGWKKRSSEDEILLELMEEWKKDELKGADLERRFVQTVTGYHLSRLHPLNLIQLAKFLNENELPIDLEAKAPMTCQVIKSII